MPIIWFLWFLFSFCVFCIIAVLIYLAIYFVVFICFAIPIEVTLRILDVSKLRWLIYIAAYPALIFAELFLKKIDFPGLGIYGLLIMLIFSRFWFYFQNIIDNEKGSC